MVLALWALCVVPGLIQYLLGDRPLTLRPTEDVDVLPLSHHLSQGLFALIGILALHTIFARNSATARGFKSLCLLLGFWLFAQVLPGIGDPSARFSPLLLTFPFVAVAIFVTQPSLPQITKTLGYLTLLTAALSVGLGWLLPTKGTVAYDPTAVAGTDKSLIGSQTLLTGMFSHPNALGVVLSLGVPFVLALRPRWLALSGLGLVGYGLLWAASRTALIAAVVAALVYVGLRLLEVRTRKQLSVMLVAVSWALVFAVPLATQDPNAFSQRGRVWIESLNRAAQEPLMGLGGTFYSDQLMLSGPMGRFAAHGHNLFVNTVTTAGVVGLISAIVLIGAAVVRTVRTMGEQAAMLTYMVTFGVVAITEVPLRVDIASSQAYIVWIPLSLALFFHPIDHGRPDDEGH